jgi:hypothetical protein
MQDAAIDFAVSLVQAALIVGQSKKPDLQTSVFLQQEVRSRAVLFVVSYQSLQDLLYIT